MDSTPHHSRKRSRAPSIHVDTSAVTDKRGRLVTICYPSRSLTLDPHCTCVVDLGEGIVCSHPPCRQHGMVLVATGLTSGMQILTPALARARRTTPSLQLRRGVGLVALQRPVTRQPHPIHCNHQAIALPPPHHKRAFKPPRGRPWKNCGGRYPKTRIYSRSKRILLLLPRATHHGC